MYKICIKFLAWFLEYSKVLTYSLTILWLWLLHFYNMRWVHNKNWLYSMKKELEDFTFFFFFFFDVWSYLFVTLRTSHFWLDSALEALREDSLHLLAICSCHFSLASFILLAKSLVYSAASSLFFLVRCFFRAICRRLCCRTHGHETLNLGCFGPRFLTIFV